MSNIYIKTIPFRYYCMKKGIFEKIMSGLKTRDFVALRTSCSIDVIVWWISLKKIRGRFFMKNFVK